jgi:nitroreductase
MEPVRMDLTREEYLALEPVEFRARFRERVHHTLEIQTYGAIDSGKRLAESQTNKVKGLMQIWEEKGLPKDAPDFQWAAELVCFAELCQAEKKVDLTRFTPKKLSEADVQAFDAILYERRSVRHWTDQEVPEHIIDKLMNAGLWAAHSCNLQSIRYLVVHEKNEPGLFLGSDIPGGPVHIVLLQDERVYNANPRNPVRNRLLDCGAAAQNIVLAAHAYNLGGCWLTFNDKMIERLNKRFNIPEHTKIVTYVDVGYPNQTPSAPRRLTLSEMVFARL